MPCGIAWKSSLPMRNPEAHGMKTGLGIISSKPLFCEIEKTNFAVRFNVFMDSRFRQKPDTVHGNDKNEGIFVSCKTCLAILKILIKKAPEFSGALCNYIATIFHLLQLVLLPVWQWVYDKVNN